VWVCCFRAKTLLTFWTLATEIRIHGSESESQTADLSANPKQPPPPQIISNKKDTLYFPEFLIYLGALL
jgi:hypothetical protein